MNDGSEEAMESLQITLTSSLDSGQAILFSDLTMQLWEIRPRPDLNPEELPMDTEDDVNSEQQTDEPENNLLKRFELVKDENLRSKQEREIIIDVPDRREHLESFGLDSRDLQQ